MLNSLSYYTSFDDHLKRIDEHIIENENLIKDCREEIEKLNIEKQKVEEEKRTFEESEYIPSFSFSEKEKTEHPEFCEKAINLIKAHEIMYHKKLMGNFYDQHIHSLYCQSNEHNPDYLFIGRESDKWDLKYIMCLDCYKEYLKNPSNTLKTHHIIPIDTEEGSSTN